MATNELTLSEFYQFQDQISIEDKNKDGLVGPEDVATWDRSTLNKTCQKEYGEKLDFYDPQYQGLREAAMAYHDFLAAKVEDRNATIERAYQIQLGKPKENYRCGHCETFGIYDNDSKHMIDLKIEHYLDQPASITDFSSALSSALRSSIFCLAPDVPSITFTDQAKAVMKETEVVFNAENNTITSSDGKLFIGLNGSENHNRNEAVYVDSILDKGLIIFAQERDSDIIHAFVDLETKTAELSLQDLPRFCAK